MKSAASLSALALVGLCAAGTAYAEPQPTPAPDGPKTSIDSGGTYAVGTDIAPGTWQTAGPVEGDACYWKRVGGDEILDNAMSKKAQAVQIEATDTTFTTNGCQPWQKTDCAPGCLPAPASPLDVLSQLGRVLTGPKTPPAPSAPAPAEAPATPTP
ncbi:hypothetical protein BVC93_14260 [Mycobacterium sp. MS1601]|uniref:hypothetical protein n=1 Tax=Mycobacterium sp. MS1601 TaxID=1936029 RepID=UPI0009794AE6|nr:hypothetical protein [Mycobacterium sp. MS1601]AQA03386.1 hypothetical protein BVC93_14260 [Mycobacterium sp. MS1601]